MDWEKAVVVLVVGFGGVFLSLGILIVWIEATSYVVHHMVERGMLEATRTPAARQ